MSTIGARACRTWSVNPRLPRFRRPGVSARKLPPDGVRISWTCPPAPGEPAGAEYRLRIYRRLVGSQADTKVAEPDLRNCQGPAVLDQTFEWEKTYDYRAASVVALGGPGEAEMEIEGDDTPAVRVFAHDVFPPAVPTGLQAVFSGVGQSPFIDLIWSPDTDADLAGYNLYRREENGEPAKVTSEPVKAPAYRDRNVAVRQAIFLFSFRRRCSRQRKRPLGRGERASSLEPASSGVVGCCRVVMGAFFRALWLYKSI